MSVLVVLALTGFSTGRGRGGGDGGGGGCSSSSQNHDSSSTSGGSHHRDYDDDDDDDYDYGSDTGTGSGSSGTSSSGSDNSASLISADTELLSCASKKVRHANVRVTNPNLDHGTFTVRLTFQERDGTGITTVEQDVAVPGEDSVTVKVYIDAAPRRAKRVAGCDLDPTAAPATR
ncbi:hypothetical protein [Streptomyces sp. enrichment culture]|uniref:hypothetical protein n=1 Tax=Streptomyces sp. enrichment culture TaxID=1795815 RepID=UPI003F55CF32